MTNRKNKREIQLMREAGRIAAEARHEAGKLIAVGATTQSINKKIHDYIVSKGALPAFLGYNGYPASVCISVNEQVIHGIPSTRKLVDGDVVSIDVGTVKDGYIGDCAATFIAGYASAEAQRLIEVTKECFYEGLKYARVGYRVSDISRAIQQFAEDNGYSVVREYVGHGVGKKIHEPPEVPNFIEYPRKRADPRLLPGMTLAIEPMVNSGEAGIKILSDGWTVVTIDGKTSAHYENTVLITDSDPEILTVFEDLP